MQGPPADPRLMVRLRVAGCGGWFGAGAVDSRLPLCKRIHIGIAARGETAPAFEARRWTGSRTVNPPRSLGTELGCRCRMT